MNGWRRVSQEWPCPICGKPDNCEVSDNGEMVYCGRVEEGSIKQNAGGQFLHRLKDSESFHQWTRTTVAKPKRERPSKPKADWRALAAQWFNARDVESHRKKLANLLGVSPDSLRELGVGFDGTAWTIPERDDNGTVIGINRRFRSGLKLRMNASNSGLTFASNWNEGCGPILLPEGASDVAALLTIGINAVGRPNDLGGTEQLVGLLCSIPNDRQLIVLGENDRKPLEKLRATHRADCEGCKQCWPGRNGAIETAKKLSAALNRPIHWAFPPDGAKDVREWLQMANTTYRQQTLIDSKALSADAPGTPEMLSALCRSFLDSLKLESINVALPPVEQPTGPVVSLADWREQLRRCRIESVGQPGINLDRSGPGYGKSFADIAAMELIVKRGGRVLVVLPTHDNCEELETELTTRRIDAVAYPGRLIDGEKQNCWNIEADKAETMGLSAVAAVCPFCPERKRCSEFGYLMQINRASEATVAIATHSRAIYAGLGTLSAGREYVAIHEDSLNVLRPSCSVGERQLGIARDEVLTRLVNDPKWLDWYGDIFRRDDDGRLIGSDKLRQRRDALREFAILLNELCDWLLTALTDHGRTRRLTAPRTIPKAIGIERLLFRATGEARKVGHRFSSSVWRLLLAAATGEIADLGVIVDGPANKRTDREETNHRYLDEPAEPKCDRLAV